MRGGLEWHVFLPRASQGLVSCQLSPGENEEFQARWRNAQLDVMTTVLAQSHDTIPLGIRAWYLDGYC